MGRVITITTCDAPGCTVQIGECLTCRCDRCEREGDHVTERFHSCVAHMLDVNVRHERIYGRAPVWRAPESPEH